MILCVILLYLIAISEAIAEMAIITGRKAGIKLTFVGLFWFLRPVEATLCTDYRQIRQRGGSRQPLTSCQSGKFWGVIWGNPAQKT